MPADQPDLNTIIAKLKEGPAEPKDTDMFRALELFISKNGIQGKTKITPAQRNMLWVFHVWHKRNPARGLQDAGEELALLLISEGGESRKGFIELFKGLLHNRQQELPQNPLPQNPLDIRR